MPPNGTRGFDWEEAGRKLGENLNGYFTIVVIGLDPVATGRVAVGMARAQAMHRRVAVGDLFAESPPIQELVTSEDPHGLVDSFLYGVSLTKIAQPVADAGQLFVMPSGTEPPNYEEILPHPRWYRLSAGFREVRALMILAAPVGAPHIEKLVAASDGAVLVGDLVPPQLTVGRIIASVRQPTDPQRPLAPMSPQEHEKPEPPKRWSGVKVAAVVGVALTLALAAIAVWLSSRPLADSHRPGRGRPECNGPNADSAACAARSPAALGLDSLRRDSLVDGAAAPSFVATAPEPFPVVTNPADSATAAGFAVELMAANTQAGAILKLQKDGKDLPAATFAPAVIQGARWFKVSSGAFSNRADADSLLAGLKRRKLLLGGESVVRLPYAFLIDSVPASAVPGLVASYADRQLPVYALRQANGNAWLLVGAFESVEQASLYVETLRASRIPPVLVYRKGRPF